MGAAVAKVVSTDTTMATPAVLVILAAAIG
jgi:hypothetical protein